MAYLRHKYYTWKHLEFLILFSSKFFILNIGFCCCCFVFFLPKLKKTEQLYKSFYIIWVDYEKNMKA